MKSCFGGFLLLVIFDDFMCCIISTNIEFNRDNRSWHRNIYKLSDPTTEYYFNQVYGPETRNSSKKLINTIDMVYNWGNFDIILPDESFVDNRGQFFYNNKKDDYMVYKDYKWAEVTRIGSMCMTGRWKFPRYEGFSTGLVKNGKKVLYGCWFHRYRGSGIFVNVGKTIAARTRRGLMSRLKISGCEQSKDANCNREHEFCAGARKQGYDSIQVNLFYWKNASNTTTTVASGIKNFLYFYPELILCTDQCVTVTFNTSCPPGVELRTGLDASKPCTCDDKYMTMNCGNASEEDKQCRNKLAPYTGKRRKTCFLLGDSITNNPGNTNITILYLNNRGHGHGQGSHHHHISSNTILDLHSAMNVSGPVYVLTCSNITLSGGRWLIEYQLIEYVTSQPLDTTAPITAVIDKIVDVRRRNIPVVQNMHFYFSQNLFHYNETGSGRLTSRLQLQHNSIDSIQYNNNSSSSNGSDDSFMYNSFRGSPLGVIAISGYVDVVLEDDHDYFHSYYETLSRHNTHKTEKELKKDKRTLLPPIVLVGNNDAVNLMWNHIGFAHRIL
eukprot:gene8684-17933_t